MTRIPWLCAAALGAVLAGCATYETPYYGPDYASGYAPFYSPDGVIVDEDFIGVPRHFHHRRDVAQAEQAARNANVPSAAPAPRTSPGTGSAPTAPQPSASSGAKAAVQPSMSTRPSMGGGREDGATSRASEEAASRPDVPDQPERH